MLESPYLQSFITEAVSEALHGSIVALLKARFRTVPRDISKRLRKIVDEDELTKLNVRAAQCSDLDAFRKELPET